VVPDYVIWIFAGIMVVGWVMVTWTLGQALVNHRVTNDPELRRFARIKLIRESILWVAQSSLFAVFLIAALIPPPRPPTVGFIIIYGLLVGSAAIALLSYHDYREMRIFFGDS